MDPVTGSLIAAGIIAIGSIVGNVILAKWGRAQSRKVSAAEKGATKINDLILECYGFKAKYCKRTCRIENLEGFVRLSSEWRGFMAQDIVLPHVAHEDATDYPGGRINDPKLTYKSPDFPKDVSLVVDQSRSTSQSRQFQIEIAGGLTSGDELDYTYETTCSKMFCMTKQELDNIRGKKSFKPEYCSLDIAFPVDVIELEIEFPEGYPVETYFGVFAGKTEFVHDSERRRKEGCFTRTARGGHFKIDSPLVGFRYFIYWIPPPQGKIAIPKVGE